MICFLIVCYPHVVFHAIYIKLLRKKIDYFMLETNNFIPHFMIDSTLQEDLFHLQVYSFNHVLRVMNMTRFYSSLSLWTLFPIKTLLLMDIEIITFHIYNSLTLVEVITHPII
jgi:hypothetical protein